MMKIMGKRRAHNFSKYVILIKQYDLATVCGHNATNVLINEHCDLGDHKVSKSVHTKSFAFRQHKEGHKRLLL